MAFLKQHLRKKWVLGGLGLLVCLLAALSVYLYQRHQALEQAQKEKAYYAQFETVDPLKDAKPITFGDQNQFVASPAGIVTKNHIISTKITRKKDGNLSAYPKKGYAYKAVVLDINDGFKRQEFDLYQAVKNYDSTLGIAGVTGIYYDGKDYGLVMLRKKDWPSSKRLEVLMDLKTGKLTDPPKDLRNKIESILQNDYKLYSEAFMDTTLNNTIGNYHLFASDLDVGYLSSDSDTANTVEQAEAAAERLNLFTDYPQLKKLMYSKSEDKRYSISPRLDMVSKEEWFNTALHWFAPAGEEDLTVYGLDSSGQPTNTAIRSYADYQAWKASSSGN